MADYDYKLAIFDLGNVVFRTDFSRLFKIWSEATGLAIDELQRRYYLDEVFQAFERGEVSPKTYYQHICDLFGVAFSYEDFVRGWNAIYGDVYEQVVESIEALSKQMT